MSDMDLPLAVRMMQDGYLMEIDALQAENAELRKELAVTNPLFETLNAANDRLIYENMELRELVRDMWRKNLGRMDNPCSWCVMGCAGDDCDFEQRMCELGVEV